MNTNKASKTPFYDKLASQTHVGIDGSVTYQTRKGPHGLIICSHAGKPDQRVILYGEPNGRVTIENLTSKRVDRTFAHHGNCCAEEFHKRIEIISRT